MALDKSKIDNIFFDGVDPKDAPDFCDSFILRADIEGRKMTDDELDEINEDRDFVSQKLHSYLN